MCHLNDLGEKHGITNLEVFNEFRSLMFGFYSERTALANGIDGQRFYLRENTEALESHDESHWFEVGIDGEMLFQKYCSFIEMLTKESANTDDYADIYSPNW